MDILAVAGVMKTIANPYSLSTEMTKSLRRLAKRLIINK